MGLLAAAFEEALLHPWLRMDNATQPPRITNRHRTLGAETSIPQGDLRADAFWLSYQFTNLVLKLTLDQIVYLKILTHEKLKYRVNLCNHC